MRRSLALIVFVFSLSSSQAETVRPAIGGGSVGMMEAPMKHVGIAFDGSDITIEPDTAVPTPLLRELTDGGFDPTKPWAVLDGKAYNGQYGWIPSGAVAPPAGMSFYIEQVSISPGLEVYEGGRFMPMTRIDEMTFDAIFETPWVWGGVMTHHVYAVNDPTESTYEATYRVYLADESTGIEPTDASNTPLYGSDTVTFTWNATPVPEPAGVFLLSCVAIAGASGCGRRSTREAAR